MAATSTDDVLRRLAASPASTGIFTDFDGTLSPTVPDPDAARPAEGAVEALRRLTGLFAEVAVVSGRPARWLAERLGGGTGELFGLHGLERWTGTAAEPVPAARPFTEAVTRARTEALASRISGLFVEDKVLGLTLHWRRAEDPGETSKQVVKLANALASSTGLVLRPGKSSIELVPPLGIDKGSVVSWRGGGLAAVGFLGDDVSDLLAFDALDELEARGATVARIGVGGAEAPAELVARSDLLLSGPAESVQFLEALAEAAAGTPAG